MKFKNLIFILSIFFTYKLVAQQGGRVVIVADISGYKGELPKSSDPAWQGNDTLVPLVVDFKTPKTMGAAYLIFPYHLEGDSLSPKSDSMKSSKIKIWRTKAVVCNNTYRWDFNLDRPSMLRNDAILKGDYLVFPGDSVHVKLHDDVCVFSGIGANKFRIKYELKKTEDDFLFPFKEKRPKDLQQFLLFNYFLNQKAEVLLSRLESNRGSLTAFEYNWTKAIVLGDIDYWRWYYINSIPNPLYNKYSGTVFSYSASDLARVWDSVMYDPNAVWYRSPSTQNLPGVGSRGSMKSFLLLELNRKLGYSPVNDTFQNLPVYKKLIYQSIRNNFYGLFRERLLCYFLNEEFIQEAGAYNWMVQSILKDYYQLSGYSAYKAWVRQFELQHQYLTKGPNGAAPLFSLTDRQNNLFTRKNTLGKFTLVNFWYTGCQPCKQTAKELRKLREKFKNDTNVIFLNVTVDKNKDQWEKSIREGKFVSEGVHLSTGGRGTEHEMIKDFNVKNFPTVRMYDQNGQITIDEEEPFANTLPAAKLEVVIARSLSKQNDGPYVFYENDKVQAFTIAGNSVRRIRSFAASTDEYNTEFRFLLRKNIAVPSSTYSAPSKMLVLSDIEGNFGALSKLLLSSRIIDKGFNWTFGEGHLVFAGDMFDRGDQVTECLWLVYSLEEKAKAAGGYVHFILGNHEIMNLQGNHKYVQQKYKDNAKLMGKTLTELYNKESELGRWLRTKNVVEKIGDILFTHGGVSRNLNNSPVTLEEINTLARAHYDDTAKTYADARLNSIMSSKVGPFWFRGYYETKPIESVVDSTLQKFDVNRIIAGHTVVADTISVHYNGKVINTDTKHASGKSEALLIEGTKFYRVNDKGQRWLLFDEADMSKTIPVTTTR